MKEKRKSRGNAFFMLPFGFIERKSYIAFRWNLKCTWKLACSLKEWLSKVTIQRQLKCDSRCSSITKAQKEVNVLLVLMQQQQQKNIWRTRKGYIFWSKCKCAGNQAVNRLGKCFLCILSGSSSYQALKIEVDGLTGMNKNTQLFTLSLQIQNFIHSIFLLQS